MYYDQTLCGQRIKKLRKISGITQEKLADKLNMSIDHLCRIEVGKRSCSIDLLIEIARYFDVSLDYLILGKEHSTSIAKKVVQWLIWELRDLEEIL